MYEDGCFDRELKPKDYPWGDSVTPIKFDEWDDLDGDSDSSDEENPWKYLKMRSRIAQRLRQPLAALILDLRKPLMWPWILARNSAWGVLYVHAIL